MLGSSPRLIAACNVLHRLPAPRHPPGALCNLPRRCSRSLWSSQGPCSVPRPTACRRSNVAAGSSVIRSPYVIPPALVLRGGQSTSRRCVPQPSKLHSVSDALRRPRSVGHNRTRRSPQRGDEVSNARLASDPRSWTALAAAIRLLRKEVIQPHLPVRLPCYDFVPIAGSTFDSSLPRVGPLASGVSDFHDVTGGVYKARERIHGAVADAPLLAIPTSCSRVADYNLNWPGFEDLLHLAVLLPSVPGIVVRVQPRP